MRLSELYHHEQHHFHHPTRPDFITVRQATDQAPLTLSVDPQPGRLPAGTTKRLAPQIWPHAHGVVIFAGGIDLIAVVASAPCGLRHVSRWSRNLPNTESCWTPKKKPLVQRLMPFSSSSKTKTEPEVITLRSESMRQRVTRLINQRGATSRMKSL